MTHKKPIQCQRILAIRWAPWLNIEKCLAFSNRYRIFYFPSASAQMRQLFKEIITTAAFCTAFFVVISPYETKKVQLSEIAKKINFPATVSFVRNGKSKEQRVSAEVVTNNKEVR